MSALLRAAVLLLVVLAARADITTTGTIVNDDSTGCTVNFSDSLGYTKPTCITVTEPTTSNEYWVDLSSGSGSSCTSGSPCTLATVKGKTGVADGGPAIIHVKGSGEGDLDGIVGSAGNEVVIKPWDDSTQANFTAQANLTGNIQYVIVDGGPNMMIRIYNDGSSDDFSSALYFDGAPGEQKYVTFWRTRMQVTAHGEYIALWGHFDHFYFINNELASPGATDTSDQHHIYVSAAGCGNDAPGGNCSHTGSKWQVHDLYFWGNVIRDTPGEGIEMRIQTYAYNIEIAWNAFHDVGIGTCGGGWGCRTAVTWSADSSGVTGGDGLFASGLSVHDNLIWDTGSGCMTWDDGITSANLTVENNTCYRWGRGSYGTVAENGFYAYIANTPPGKFANNIIYGTGNDGGGNALVPWPSAPSGAVNNACKSGASCGSSSQTVSDASFVSLDETNANFLKIASGATPIDNGTNSYCSSRDYFGTSRPANSTCDIGAQEQ